MRVFISIARNIYNVKDVDIYLASIRTSNPLVSKWIKSNLRNYIITKYEKALVDVTSPREDDPEWVKKAIEKGDLQKIDFRSHKWTRFAMYIQHAIPYLETVRDPSRVSVEDAIKGGNDLIEEQNKKASDVEDLNGIEVIHEFKDGWKFVNVVSKQSLEREGKIMQHCVGQEEQEYIRNVANKSLEIWSLRDPKNEPHCTIEYLPKGKGKKIQQIKGKHNKGVIKKYVPYVKEFLEIQDKKSLILEYKDLANIGIVESDGVWYDLFNLPSGITIDDDLDLEESDIEYLPENLNITGSLNVYGCKKLKSLPKNLTVGKTLFIKDSNVETLGDGISVGNSLFLSGTIITALPKNLKVGKDLSIIGSNVVSIGEGLVVGRFFNIENSQVTFLPKNLTVNNPTFTLVKTKVTELPEGFNVRGDLDLRDSLITVLPKDLVVVGDLIAGAKLKTIQEGVVLKRCLDLRNCPIRSLPKNLKVGTNLRLLNSGITELPEGLEVGGSLDLEGTKIKTLPKKLKVRGYFDLDRSSIRKLPENFTFEGLLDLRNSDIDELPEGLDVTGSLDIRETNITKMPAKYRVSGKLIKDFE